MSGRTYSISVILIPVLALACSPPLEVVDYRPAEREDWTVSTPSAQGLDSTLVDRLYVEAARRSMIWGVLVVKDGVLVAERYFNDGSIDRENRMQSVTKSFTSALAGTAVREGCLPDLDEPMMTYFPELADQVKDARKNDITVRQLLQMRAGYEWEEANDELFGILYGGFRASTLLDIPLNRDPGTSMKYSNLSSHLVGIIVARACDTDLMTFANEHLFGPLGIEPGEWITDWEGHYNGHADLHMTARDMARFGQVYLDGGRYDGRQIVPEEWIEESLQIHSKDAWGARIGRNVRDMSYGYQWWNAQAGPRRYSFAWGHGGQQIALLPEYDLVVVVVADPQFGDHGGGSWRHERAHLNLVGDFMASLPPR